MPNDYDIIDEALLPFHRFLSALNNLEGMVGSEDAGLEVSLTEASLEMPILLEIAAGKENRLVLGVSPPIYYVATGVEPVYHQMRLTIQVTDQEETDEA